MTELPAETRNLPMVATYWPPTVNDGFGGVGYGQPVVISCRWEDVRRLFRNDTGEEVVSDAVIFVDRVLQNKGKIVLGEHSSATPVPEAKEIRNVDAVPSIRATKQLNTVYV